MSPVRGTAGAAAWRRRFDAVLFDLDGTLVETAPDLCNALNHALARLERPGIDLLEIRAMIGDGARAMLTKATARAPLTPEQFENGFTWLLEHYWEHVAVDSRPFDGVAASLESLRRQAARLAVVTNKPAGLSNRLLDLLDLAAPFEAVVGADSLAVRKPDAGHILGTLELLDTAPDRAVMVGDSANDVKAARNAGVPVIAVSFGYTTTPAHALGADLVIDHFDELEPALNSLAEAPSPA